MRSFEMNIETGDELAAVNEILGTIGEPPVSTLEGDANADVASARRILNMVNRRIQMQGWTFNIEENLALLPDTFSNLIPYSSDYLSLMSTSGTSVYVNRGGYIFDRTTNTDRFTGPIEVRIIRLKGFEEMPECFRHWIVTAAAKKFNASFFGAPEVDGATSEDLIEARRVCMEWEMDYGKFNMLDGDAFTGGKLAR